MNIPSKTSPYRHQVRANDLLSVCISSALFMEMGTGKTKVILDDATRLFIQQKITKLIVIAPNGVHTGWVTEEAPKHLSINWLGAAYYAQPNKAQKKAWSASLKNTAALVLQTINVETLSRKQGVQKIAELFHGHKVMFVVDESHTIKTYTAQRTRNILALRRKAAYRRILTGTPVTQSPLDLFAQFYFLDPRIIGYNNFYAFRARYAVLQERTFGRQRAFKVVTGYRNLQELKDKITPYCFTARKADCLDLPEKIYEKIPVVLSRSQRRIYNELLQTGVASLSVPRQTAESEEDYLWRTMQGTDRVEASNALSLVLRLQQLSGGFLPGWEATPNPKLNALLELLAALPKNQSIIIFTQFRDEISGIAAALQETRTVAEYHGGVSNQQRQERKQAFQDGRLDTFLATLATGGTGLNLTRASMVIYYSNGFKAALRWQSEDRAHRIGQPFPVTYIDLVAQGTIDERILKVLKTKRQLAEEVVPNVQ